MSKLTKKAKIIELKCTPETYTVIKYEYHCPTCGTYFQGGNYRDVVTFMCSCGQKLTINNVSKGNND